MDIQENSFIEALLDEIEDQWENFLNQASCHFHPELEAPVDEEYEQDLPPFEPCVCADDDDELPW